MQMVKALAYRVDVGASVERFLLHEELFDELDALLERVVQGGGVEDDVRDLLPVVALIMPFHDADRLRELLAIQPQLTVQRQVGQPGDEPVRSVKDVAKPRD